MRYFSLLCITKFDNASTMKFVTLKIGVQIFNGASCNLYEQCCPFEVNDMSIYVYLHQDVNRMSAYFMF